MDERPPIRFDRLRDCARAGRAPWRRQGDRLIFLTTRKDDGPPDHYLSPPAFAAELRAQFTEELIHAAAERLSNEAPADSARHVITTLQKSAFGLCILLAIAFAIIAPGATALIAYIGLAILFSIMIAVRLALAAIAAAPKRAHKRQPLADSDLPVVTVLVPLFREAKALPGLAAALARLDYPADRLDIKLLLEECDHGTIAEARRLCSEERFDLVIVPPSAPQTKPKALNFALPTARGDLVVIYDAEDEPDPSQLKIAAETFAAGRGDLGCVQARLNFYNSDENWLTRLFTLEYCLWFDWFLPALDRLGAPIPLGGTSNIFRIDALIDAGGWDPHNVTEDADLGLRLARRGWRTAIIASTTHEEATCSLPNWIRQRSRWMKGFMQTWLVHRRQPVGAGGWKSIMTVDLFIGGAVVAALTTPVLWILSFVEIATGETLAGLAHAPSLGVATAALSLGNAALIALAGVAPLSRGMARLSPFAVLMPVYWLLMAWAAYVALWQLASRPHFWEKTDHGLSTGADARRRAALKSLGFD